MTRAASLSARLADRLKAIGGGRFGSFWLGLAVTAALSAGYVAWCAALGSLDALFDPSQPLGLSSKARGQTVTNALIGFLLATRHLLTQRAPEHWAPVQPLTHLSPDAFGRFVRDEVARAGRRRPALDLLGALLGLGVVLLSTGRVGLVEVFGSPTLLWALGANALAFVLMTRAAASSILGRSYASIAGAIREFDLLDPRPLRCFGQQGLRRAFYWAGGSSIASLLAWDLDRVGPLVTILALTLGLATYALLEPARILRHRVRDAKEAELAGVRPRIRAAREKLWAGGEAGELPALLAYEQRLMEVSEWPFDAPTLVRFGALALVATGSWLGGALVERALDGLLGGP